MLFNFYLSNIEKLVVMSIWNFSVLVFFSFLNDIFLRTEFYNIYITSIDQKFFELMLLVSYLGNWLLHDH